MVGNPPAVTASDGELRPEAKTMPGPLVKHLGRPPPTSGASQSGETAVAACQDGADGDGGGPAQGSNTTATGSELPNVAKSRNVHTTRLSGVTSMICGLSGPA